MLRLCCDTIWLFQASFVKLMAGVLHCGQGDTTEYFCSEFVAEALQQMGAMDSDEKTARTSDNYIPGDFEGRKWYDKFLDYLKCRCCAAPGKDIMNTPLGAAIDLATSQPDGMKNEEWHLAEQVRIKFSKELDSDKLQQCHAGEPVEGLKPLKKCSCDTMPVSFIDFKGHHWLIGQQPVPSANAEAASKQPAGFASSKNPISSTSVDLEEIVEENEFKDVPIGLQQFARRDC